MAPREGVSRDFGSEAIDTLVKEMEDRRSQLAVILAGYPHEIERLWSGNPGLKNTVCYQIIFPDYSVDELASLLYAMAAARGYTLTVDTSVAARAWLERAGLDASFANAGSVRNFLGERYHPSVHALRPDRGSAAEQRGTGHAPARRPGGAA